MSSSSDSSSLMQGPRYLYIDYSCCVYSLTRVDLDCDYLHTPCIYIGLYMLYYTLGPFEALRSWNIGNNNNKLRSRRGRVPCTRSSILTRAMHGLLSIVRARFLAAVFSDGSHCLSQELKKVRHMSHQAEKGETCLTKLRHMSHQTEKGGRDTWKGQRHRA